MRRKTNEGVINNGLKVQKTEATPPKKRGRPRKSLGTDVIVDGAPDVDGLDYLIATGATPVAKPNPEATSTRTRGKGRRKAMSPFKVTTDSNASMNDYEVSAVNGDAQTEDTQARKLSEEPLSSPSHGRWGRTSMVQQGNLEVEVGSATAASVVNVSSAELSPNPKPPDMGRQSSMKDINEAAEAIVENRGSDFQDPTDEHHEFDSILESEGFTMVSLSSLPSAQMQMSTLPELRNSREATLPIGTQHDSKEQSFAPLNTAEQGLERPGFQGDSLMPHAGSKVCLHSSTLDFTQTPPSGSEFDSSQLYKVIPQQTSSQAYSSPMLPPPVQPAASSISPQALDKPTEGTPKMDRVVRVGTALQGVVSPADRNRADPPSNTQQPDRSSSARPGNANQNDIFSGFGAGSRRELRAGLRLGQELARRQRLTGQATATVNNTPNEVFQAAEDPKSAFPQRQAESSLALPGAQSQVEYPTLPKQQLPSPDRTDEDDEDRMSWKADTPAKNKAESVGSCAIESSPIDTRMLARMAEWQKEREAVSREIEEANSSQVIVIGSSVVDDADDLSGDEEDKVHMDGEETIDIWQSEAQQSSRLEPSTSADTSESLFPEQVIKPRRSKLPSSWRKNSQVVYSDEVEPLEQAIRQPVLKHAATPQQSKSLKRARLEASNYSMLSEFAIKPDDESSLMGDNMKHSDVEDSEEELPAKKKNSSRGLTHSQYYDKMVDDIDDTWIVDNIVPDPKSPFAPAPKQHPTIKAKKPKKSNHSRKPKPAKEPAQPPTSWLSRITNYVPLFLFRSIAPTAPSPAPAPTPPSPTYAPRSPPPSNTFSIYLPWTACHYRALQRVYLLAQKDPYRYPYNTDSPAAFLLGETIESAGWKKDIEEWEIGVIDAFLDIMDRAGVDDGELDGEGREREEIKEEEVARRVFSLWVGQVQRGEVGVGRGTVGMFDERLQWRKKAVVEAAREGR